MTPAVPKDHRAFQILVINPGSTSTKVALFRGARCVRESALRHAVAELRAFPDIAAQADMRAQAVLTALAAFGLPVTRLDAVAARGGLLPPCPSGTYRVNPAMLAILTAGRYGAHASNLGAIVGARLAAQAGVSAYIVDPVTVDELEPAARLTGLPEISRRSIWHALNQKAVARLVAARLGVPYPKARLVVAHLGGGISVAAHRHGRAIDVNNALEGEGPFAVERSGGLPAAEVARLARRVPEAELLRRISGAGGVVAHLGTNDMPEALRRARGGDTAARLVLQALVRQVAREIGACATTLGGKIDAVVLCGGLAHCRPLTQAIGRRVRFLAPLHVVPGEREMEALALGVLRVLRREERARLIS